MSANTPHLNVHSLEIRTTAEKGRGVYASQEIPRGTAIEISPVLFFSQEEYERHGKYTILDSYTFVWGDGRMALPLGLGKFTLLNLHQEELLRTKAGSLFNHSETPNVTFIKKKEEGCIEYRTARGVGPGEELCIFYGQTLWFIDRNAGSVLKQQNTGLKRPEDACNATADNHWGGLGALSI